MLMHAARVPTAGAEQASQSHLDLNHAQYNLYGVKYIDPVSLAPCAGQVQGKWTEWSEYIGCTALCGDGTTFRSRECEGGKCGGTCSGLAKEKEGQPGLGDPCNTGVCDDDVIRIISAPVLENVVKMQHNSKKQVCGLVCVRACPLVTMPLRYHSLMLGSTTPRNRSGVRACVP